jgi:hypothetical protein
MITTRATILSLLATIAAACGDDGNSPAVDAPPPPPDTASGVQIVDLPPNITSNMTLTEFAPATGPVYRLPRNEKVFVMPGMTLTIQPGAKIIGDKGSVLVVSRGAKIMAEGTPQKPIVFTSAQPDGMKTPGFWGGILILGKAPINTNVRSTPPSNQALFEAFSNADGELGQFGGDLPADNSGVLKYARIEFGGFNFVADREFNNLTLCGVGSGTTIDFVQVHRGSDDGIEFFGGTVNVKHIVSSQNSDDGFDTDNGWQGKAQFIVIQHVLHAASGDASNGYESDNHGTAASFTADPRTLPRIANVTLIGDRDTPGAANWAAIFRRGAGGHYLNHIWVNFGRGPEVRDAETMAMVPASLSVKYSMLFNNDTTANSLPATDTTPAFAESTIFNADNHDQLTVDPGLPAAATSKTAPDFKPVANAAALTAGIAPKDDPNFTDAFFDPNASFAGAIGTDDWTKPWTAYPEN